MRTIRDRITRGTASGGHDGADDSGLTIVELVIAMSIFSLVLVVYFGSLISMSQTTAEAQARVDSSNSLRASFQRLDRQVRYASAINMPGQGPSGAWYVEFELTKLPDNAQPLCYQWRLDPSTEIMSLRSWRQDGSSSVTQWVDVAWDVTSTGGGSPFTFSKATALAQRQSLALDLTTVSVQGDELSQLSTVFVARNSSQASRSNEDGNGDGQSDDPVCMTGMDRP